MEGFSDINVDRDDFFRVKQGMPALFNVNNAVRIEDRLRALIFFCIFCFCKNKIKLCKNFLILLQITGASCCLRT